MRRMHAIPTPSPETVADCPWCAGRAVVSPDRPGLDCPDCGIAVPLAGDSTADLALAP
jgi:hypothetical protein